VVRLRAVRRVARFAEGAFFVALRRRRFLAGALDEAFFVDLRRFFAGDFFAAFFVDLRRFLVAPVARFFVARFFVARFFVAFFAVDFRLVVFRFAGDFLAALRFAGAFLARLFVAFFAGGTVTTFLRELSLGEVRTSFTRCVGEQPTPYAIRSCSRASSARTPR
jgi:hypothetical protein